MLNKIKLVGISTVLTFIISFFIFSGRDNNSNKSYMGYKNDVFWKGTSKHAHHILNRALSFETHFGWATGNHTASPVVCGAVGPEKYTNKLEGIIQNTDIAKVCKEAVADGINVMLVIGDGMGINQMSLPIYMNIAEGSDNITNFERILNEGSCGISLTNPIEGLVTGSASAGTALASGTKTYTHALGVDTTGKPLESTLEMAEKRGVATGLITDTGITDATPAAFYAHSVNRNLENNVAAQLIENNTIEVIFGGGAKRFLPQGEYLKDYFSYNESIGFENSTSSRDDNKNLFKVFQSKDYEIICNREELLNLDGNTERVLGLFSSSGLSAYIDRDNEITSQPNLVEMTSKGLEILNNNKNYFVMIEAGRIDWEAHDNDAGSVYKAVEEMDEVLSVCYDQYKANKNKTLLIFTADHETGGFSISYTKLPKGQYHTKELKNGEIWKNRTDPLLFEKFLLLKEQKSSIYTLFEKSKKPQYIYNKINNNIGYKITKEDAEVINNVINDYKKGK